MSPQPADRRVVTEDALAGVVDGKADLIGGLVDPTQLPPLAINDTFTAADEPAMLALTAQRGDVAVRTDLSSTFILTTDDPTLVGNWAEILTPGQVVSVAGRTGAVVLTKADVGLPAADDTSDADKPVSTAQQTALDAKQDEAALDTDVAALVADNGTTVGAYLDAILHSVVGVPGAGVGKDGDYAKDLDTGSIYEKITGTWQVTGYTLIGPAGESGANGADGADGADGLNGVTGISPILVRAPIATGTGGPSWTNDTGRPLTITAVRIRVLGGVATGGSSTIVDVNVADVTIFTNQANRPTLTVGATTVLATTIDAPTLNPGQTISIDVDQISTWPASTELAVFVIAE